MAGYEIYCIQSITDRLINRDGIRKRLNEGWLLGELFEREDAGSNRDFPNVYQIVYKLPPSPLPRLEHAVASVSQANDPSGFTGGTRSRQSMTRKRKHRARKH